MVDILWCDDDEIIFIKYEDEMNGEVDILNTIIKFACYEGRLDVIKYIELKYNYEYKLLVDSSQSSIYLKYALYSRNYELFKYIFTPSKLNLIIDYIFESGDMNLLKHTFNNNCMIDISNHIHSLLKYPNNQMIKFLIFHSQNNDIGIITLFQRYSNLALEYDNINICEWLFREFDIIPYISPYNHKKISYKTYERLCKIYEEVSLNISKYDIISKYINKINSCIGYNGTISLMIENFKKYSEYFILNYELKDDTQIYLGQIINKINNNELIGLLNSINKKLIVKYLLVNKYNLIQQLDPVDIYRIFNTGFNASDISDYISLLYIHYNKTNIYLINMLNNRKNMLINSKNMGESGCVGEQGLRY